MFVSGNLDLQLANGLGSFSDNITGTFGGTDISPGVCLEPSILNIKNVGTVASNHLDISVSNTNNAFAAFLRIQSLTFDGVDVSITDTNNNGFRDLQDLSEVGIVNKPLTDFSAHPLVMQVCLDNSAGNEQQSQTNTVDFSVLLDQGPHS